jgi:hypothetical protein
MSGQPPEIEAKMRKKLYGGIIILGILFITVIAGMTWKFFLPYINDKIPEIETNPY